MGGYLAVVDPGLSLTIAACDCCILFSIPFHIEIIEGQA
jgi:hypothetical protein